MIPKVAEPTGLSGSSDFYYGAGLLPYPASKVPRLAIPSESPVFETQLVEVVGATVTLTFTPANGSSPVTIPESRISFLAPRHAVAVYVGNLWYDVSSAATNVTGNVFFQIVIDDSPLEVSKGLLMKAAPNRPFVAGETEDAILFTSLIVPMLVGPGLHTVQCQMYVDNAADLNGNIQVKISDRQWTVMGFDLLEV